MSNVGFIGEEPVVRISVPAPSEVPLPPVWGSVFSGAPEPRPPDPYEETGAPRGYRVRSDEVWAAAREDYEIGFSAEVICERMNLGLSAFRQRARREGWRREDQAADEVIPPSLRDQPPPLPAEPPPAPPTADLADLAWRSAAEAVRRSEVYKARAWLKLHAELKAAVLAEENEKRVAAMLERKAREEEEAARLHRLHCEEREARGEPDPVAEHGALMGALDDGIARAGLGEPITGALKDIRDAVRRKGPQLRGP